MRKLHRPERPVRYRFYRYIYPDATWDDFKNAVDYKVYEKVKDTLYLSQQGVCGYCEIDLSGNENDRQVEHYLPKGKACYDDQKLNLSNFLLCCKGGTVHPSAANLREGRRLDPLSENRSCGENKEDTDPKNAETRILSPYELPDKRVFNIKETRQGIALEPDLVACRECNVLPEDIISTIDHLNLNCPRLQEARWYVIEEIEKDMDDFDNGLISLSVVLETNLAPIEREESVLRREKRLPQFFTTRRCFLGAAAEEFLASEKSS